MLNIDIAHTIKNLRTRKRVTQKQLAAYLGVTEQAVSRWENGTGYPDIELLPSIASYFSISADELLGINRDARESRLAEIRREIKLLSDDSGGENEETVEKARLWAAEFPGEEDIQENLASVICRFTMWDEKPKRGLLEEAEKIDLTLIETTANPEFRSSILEQLAALYAVGFRDLRRAEDTVNRLPKMRYCRESVMTSVFNPGTIGEKAADYIESRQDYIEKLTDALGLTLLHYITDDIPNGPERWDEKIGYLRQIIALYKMVFGENMLIYHDRAAYLYRVIATYTVAQGKTDETLDCLEAMTAHAEQSADLEPGRHFTSPFTDHMVYEGQTEDFHINEAHNYAYYCRWRMEQSRYDSLRENERFKAILARLDAAAK